MAHSQSAESDGFRQDVQGVSRGFDTLTTDVKNLALGAADAARSGASELRHAAKDKVDDARQAAAQASASFKDAVAANPMASVAIAAGAGVVIGMLIGRSRN